MTNEGRWCFARRNHDFLNGNEKKKDFVPQTDMFEIRVTKMYESRVG